MEKFLEQPFSHHAFLFVGDRKALLVNARRILEKDGIDTFNLDERNFETFNIEDARNLKNDLSLKPEDDRQRLVLISMGSTSHEAVQTLLKTVEEPGENTRLMFFVEPQISLPDTFLSRFVIYRDSSADNNMEDEARSFLKSNIESRLKQIEKMDAEGRKSKEENYFKKNAILLVGAIERIMYENLKDGNVDSAGMHKIIQAKDFLRDKGSMTKMILESIALTAPKLK